jgi:hypothetical protein
MIIEMAQVSKNRAPRRLAEHSDAMIYRRWDYVKQNNIFLFSLTGLIRLGIFFSTAWSF